MSHWVFGVAMPLVEGRYRVSVRDLAEVVTSGATRAEAHEQALDAIVVSLAFRMKQGEELPRCTPVQDGEEPVALPAAYAAKASLYGVWRDSGWSKSEFARRLGHTENEARRILDLTHPTKLDRLEDAARALGVRFTIGLAPVGSRRETTSAVDSR